MKSWAKRNILRFKKLPVSIANSLVGKFNSDIYTNLAFVKSLKEIAKMRDKERNSKILCPAEVEMELRGLCYFNIYPSEKFEQLESGICNLIKMSQKKINKRDDLARINDWFGNGGVKLRGYSWICIDNITIDCDDYKEFSKYVSSFQLHLTQVSPSFVVLLIIARPTTTAGEMFLKTIQKSVRTVLRINKFNFLTGRYGLSIKDELVVKMEQIDEYFAKINKLATSYFDDCLGAELKTRGTIKSIEVLGVNVPINSLLKYLEFSGNGSLSEKNFFKALRNTWNLEYANTDWFCFSEVKRDDKFVSKAFQVIYSSSSYMDNSSEPKDEELPYKIMNSFRHILPNISVILALECLTHEVANRLFIVRKQIAITMLNSRGLLKFKKNMTKNVSRFYELNEVYFHFKRILTEVDIDWSERALSVELPNIYWNSYDGNMVKYFPVKKAEIERFSENINNDVHLLRNTYQDFIQFRFAKANLYVQYLMIFFTGIVTLLTIILAFDSPTIKELISSIMY
jgi:hypothetical protein